MAIILFHGIVALIYCAPNARIGAKALRASASVPKKIQSEPTWLYVSVLSASIQLYVPSFIRKAAKVTWTYNVESAVPVENQDGSQVGRHGAVVLLDNFEILQTSLFWKVEVEHEDIAVIVASQRLDLESGRSDDTEICTRTADSPPQVWVRSGRYRFGNSISSNQTDGL